MRLVMSEFEIKGHVFLSGSWRFRLATARKSDQGPLSSASAGRLGLPFTYLYISPPSPSFLLNDRINFFHFRELTEAEHPRFGIWLEVF